jgi:hypothetical protein
VKESFDSLMTTTVPTAEADPPPPPLHQLTQAYLYAVGTSSHMGPKRPRVIANVIEVWSFVRLFPNFPESGSRSHRKSRVSPI